ncbi:MAG: nuclear transport factor 2 family protein [Polyangiaceae bacterium]
MAAPVEANAANGTQHGVTVEILEAGRVGTGRGPGRSELPWSPVMKIGHAFSDVLRMGVGAAALLIFTFVTLRFQKGQHLSFIGRRRRRTRPTKDPRAMRTNRTTVAAALLCLNRCSSETVGPPPPAPVNWQSFQAHPVVDAGANTITAKERTLPESYAAALASPGFALLGPLFDDEANFSSPGLEDAHGRGPVVRAHERLFGPFDNRKFTTSRVWRTPNEQTVEWTMTGTQEHDFLGVAPSHKPVAFKGLTLLWTQDDGSVTDVHVYVDVALVKAQLGVGPKELLTLPLSVPPSFAAHVFEPTSTGSEGEQSLAVAKSWLDALENNREAEYVAMTTDDVELYTLERAQPARGKASVEAYYKAMHRSIGQLDTTVDNGWGVAQFAVIEYSIDGEQLGPIGWVAAQRDKVFRVEVVDIYEIDNGKIARVYRYDNPSQIASASAL